MKHYKSNTTFVHEIAIIFSPIYSSEATSVITVVHLIHSHKKRAEPAVLRTYVENQAILEPILLYRGSKCKQTKEQDSEECL